MEAHLVSVDDVQSALQSNTSELSKIFQSMLTAMNNQSSLAKVQQEEINVLKSEIDGLKSKMKSLETHVASDEKVKSLEDKMNSFDTQLATISKATEDSKTGMNLFYISGLSSKLAEIRKSTHRQQSLINKPSTSSLPNNAAPQNLVTLDHNTSSAVHAAPIGNHNSNHPTDGHTSLHDNTGVIMTSPAKQQTQNPSQHVENNSGDDYPFGKPRGISKIKSKAWSKLDPRRKFNILNELKIRGKYIRIKKSKIKGTFFSS